MHSPDKVLMGSVASSIRKSKVFDSDPANTPAGSFVSLASNGSLSLLKSAGMRVGVSMGKSLSETKKTNVCVKGRYVSALAHKKRARAIVTITSYTALVSGTDDGLKVGATTFVAQDSAASPGAATFQAATSNEATALSLATQINAHATANQVVYASRVGAVVTIYAKEEGAAGNAIDIEYDENDTNAGLTITGASGDDTLDGGSDDNSAIDYAVTGQKVYINDVTGKADVAMVGLSTVSDAIYSEEGPLTGISESQVEVPAVIVHMNGGL